MSDATANLAPPLPDSVDTLVIGGSQAGLSVSYLLKQADHDHIVLEAYQIGASWLNKL